MDLLFLASADHSRVEFASDVLDDLAFDSALSSHFFKHELFNPKLACLVIQHPSPDLLYHRLLGSGTPPASHKMQNSDN